MSSLLKDTDPTPLHSLLSPADVPEESLYKSDPARKSKSGKTSFTRQADIEEVGVDSDKLWVGVVDVVVVVVVIVVGGERPDHQPAGVAACLPLPGLVLSAPQCPPRGWLAAA